MRLLNLNELLHQGGGWKRGHADVKCHIYSVFCQLSTVGLEWLVFRLFKIFVCGLLAYAFAF